MAVGTITSLSTELPALKLVQSSRTAWRAANALLTLLVLCIIAMLFVPWQQSAKGTGKVVAYVPQERQQTVSSPVKGVVVDVADGLREGMRVKQGDLILELEPSAANLQDQLEGQTRNLAAKLATANTKADAGRDGLIALMHESGGLEISRDANAADFLVPASGSELLTSGCGIEYPSFVGAKDRLD